MTIHPKTDEQPLVTNYEQLRSRVLSGSIWGVRGGLAVLLQKGMASWIKVWSSCQQALTVLKASRCTTAEQKLPEEQYDKLVNLFTNMALNRLQEIHV